MCLWLNDWYIKAVANTCSQALNVMNIRIQIYLFLILKPRTLKLHQIRAYASVLYTFIRSFAISRHKNTKKAFIYMKQTLSQLPRSYSTKTHRTHLWHAGISIILLHGCAPYARSVCDGVCCWFYNQHSRKLWNFHCFVSFLPFNRVAVAYSM